MERIVIEEDYRNIEWVEDYPYDAPAIPSSATKSYLKALTAYVKEVKGEDLKHYFTVIDGDTVDIIPASQYKVEE